MAHKYRVAVYGTLRNGEGNHGLLRDARFIGQGRVEGYKMVSNGGFPAVYATNDNLDEIVAEVYEVNETQLMRLHGLEGFRSHDNKWYDLGVVVVEENVDGQMSLYHGAFIYRWTAEECDGLRPIPSGDWKLRHEEA